MFGNGVHSNATGRLATSLTGTLILAFLVALVSGPEAAAEQQLREGAVSTRPPFDKHRGELSWEMPGRVSIYNLQFGPAVFEDNEWKFLDDSRTFNVKLYKERLTLMVRFSYFGSRSEIPLKFVVKLPDSRQYDETVNLVNRRGEYTYHFTIHNPANFLGSGSIYLYYGFSIVDVLDFTIVSGS